MSGNKERSHFSLASKNLSSSARQRAGCFKVVHLSLDPLIVIHLTKSCLQCSGHRRTIYRMLWAGQQEDAEQLPTMHKVFTFLGGRAACRHPQLHTCSRQGSKKTSNDSRPVWGAMAATAWKKADLRWRGRAAH
eukprot:1150431-Pelagomonas_calceolata.AAC.2